MSRHSFSAFRTSIKGKQGILKPDEHGYYTMPIGGLNAYNSANALYVFEEACKLFEENSIFMRRVKNGNLKAELGHPKRTPGMTDDDYMDRYLTIEETNVCAHFHNVSLDMSFGKNNPHYNNPDLIGIIGTFKPAGAMGHVLKAAMENQRENVNFSIRSLTRDSLVRGRHIKVLDTILGFDYVTEPGIEHATKWDAHGLESLCEMPVTLTEIQRVVKNRRVAGVSAESQNAIANEIIASMEALKKPTINVTKPPFARW